MEIGNDEGDLMTRASALRRRAEWALRHSVDDQRAQHAQEVETLIHELQVYQLELEMQNEALRQAQVQLGESHDRYSELYDFAPVGYITVGITGLIEQANLTSATMLGLARAHLLKLPLSRFVHFEDQDLLYQHRRQILAEPQLLHRVELRMMHAGTRPFTAQLESGAVSTIPGQFTGYRTVLSDITARKQSEAALLASNQQLTTTLAQLLAAQAILVQQERMAAVGQVAAGIAHDFNNSLAVINFYTELLLYQETLEPRAYKRLHMVKAQIVHAKDIVQQILDFSRQSTTARQTIDLSRFLADVVELLARTLPDTLQLTLHLHDDGCSVNGDGTQLQQIFVNLVNNARDAMPGGGMIEIVLTQLVLSAQDPAPFPTMSPGPWAMIQVTDRGSGIPPEVLPHIFEPFFTTKAHQGSGLGLAQVYGIVKQHGGEVEAITRLGKGTTFTLYLPRIAATPVAIQSAALPALSASDGADSGLTGNGETLLIVDDNAMLRGLFADLLELAGYHVLMAADGPTALQLYRQQHQAISLVITDLTMPQMNGIELTNALFQIDPQVKVIIATGHQPDFGVKGRLRSDEVAWLQKPITIDLLQQTVGQMLQVP